MFTRRGDEILALRRGGNKITFCTTSGQRTRQDQNRKEKHPELHFSRPILLKSTTLTHQQ